MIAALDHPPTLEHHDLVGVADGAQSVRDGQGGAAGHQVVQRSLQLALRAGVQRRGGLVEHEDRRVHQQGAGHGQSLPLATAEPMAAGTDNGLQPVGEGRDHVVHLCGGERCPQFRVGRLRGGLPQVGSDGGVREVGLLGDHADDPAAVGRGQVTHVDAVDQHPTGGGIGQPHQQGRQRRLPGTGLPHYGDRLTGDDGQVDVAQGVPVTVGEAVAHMLEAHLTPDDGWLHPHRIERFRHLDRQVEVAEDPAEERHRSDPLGTDVEQAHDRPEDRTLQAGEGDQGADGDAAGDRGEPGHQVQHRGDGREDDTHGGHPPATGELGAHLEVDQRFRGLGEARLADRTAAKGFGEQGTVDAEGLLHLGVQVGERLLLGHGEVTPHQRNTAGEQDGRRQHEQRQQRQPPVQGDHGDGRCDGGGQVGCDRGGGRRDHRLQAGDVLHQPGLDVAPAGALEERDRLGLQVREDAGAQDVHDPLPHRGRQPGLPHPEDPGDGRHGDHAANQPGQQLCVTGRQRHVDDLAQQERLGEPDDGCDDDDRGDHGKFGSVPAEQSGHAPQAHRRFGELGLVDRVDARRPARFHGVDVCHLRLRYTEVTTAYKAGSDGDIP